MLTERIPIERFIYQRINTPKIKKAIEPLNVDPDLIQRSLVKVFVDMGVFVVQPGQDGPIEAAMLDEIRRMREAQRSRPAAKTPKHSL